MQNRSNIKNTEIKCYRLNKKDSATTLEKNKNKKVQDGNKAQNY